MQQLDAVEQAGRFELPDTVQHLRGGKAELRLFAPGVLPVAAAQTGQANTHAEQRPHAELAGFADDRRHLGGLFDHDDGAQAEASGNERAADVVAILVAVADDQAARTGQREHGHEFGFAAGLEAHPLPTMADDFLHHGALLVHLDGIDGGIAPAIAVMGDRRIEGAAQGVDPIVQDVGESDQDGQVQARPGHALSQFRQRYAALGRIAQRQRDDMSVRIHVEVALAPFRHVIAVAGGKRSGVAGHEETIDGEPEVREA